MTNEREMARDGKFSLPPKQGKMTYNVIVVSGGKTRTLKANGLDEARSKAAELVDSVYESGTETESKVIVRAVEWCQDTTFFDGTMLAGYRMANRGILALKARNIPEESMDQWHKACDWARERGVKIRRGKVTLALAITRVGDAGLMEEWNATWPQFAFIPEKLEESREAVERRKMYYGRMERNKNRGDA